MIFAPAGKAQQLSGQLGAILHIGFDIFYLLIVGMTVFRLQTHQRGISLNSHEYIIEVMGNAARQGADRLHFLGLLDLEFNLSFFSFRIFSFGHIPQNASESDRIPIRFSDKGSRQLQG